MGLRTNGIIQLLAGALLVIVGALAAGSSYMLAGVSGRLTVSARDAAEQCGSAADACRDTLPLLGDIDRSSTAARESLTSLRKSMDELAKREDTWRQTASKINDVIGGVGNRIKSLGSALDFEFPVGAELTWDKAKGIPYPSGVTLQKSDRLQKIAKPMEENGQKLVDTGATVKDTVDTVVNEFERNRVPLSKTLSRNAK